MKIDINSSAPTRITHEAFDGLDSHPTLLEITERICKYLGCYLIYREGVFYMIPNGENPTQEMLALGLEAVKQIADSRGANA